MSEANETKAASAELRKMVFVTDPKDYGLTKESLGQPVWGVVMETGFPEGSYSLVVLAEGSTSIYFSNGGGIIGGGQHESVRKVSKVFLNAAQQFHVNAVKATNTVPPINGEVKFYFLTFDGTLVYSAKEDDLGNDKDDLSPFFYAAHNVITEVREIEEKR